MSEDLKLNLMDGIKLNSLEIVPEFDKYSELVQRTVVLCLLNQSLNLTTDEIYLYDLVQTANTGSIQKIMRSLVPLADRIKEILNAEEEEDIVNSVIFSLEQLSNRSFKIYINIEKTDDTEEQGVVVVNG